MKNTLLLTVTCALLSLFSGRAGATNFIGDTTNAPTYNRTTETGQSSFFGRNVPYSLFTITVPVNGLYSFNVVAANPVLLDTFITLYNTPFSAADPENNFLIANDNTNDNKPNLGSSFSTNLTTGGNYTLAVSGLTFDDYGSFTGAVTGPGTPSVTTVPEPSTTGLIAVASCGLIAALLRSRPYRLRWWNRRRSFARPRARSGTRSSIGSRGQ